MLASLIATSSGNKNAVEKRDIIAKRMTPSQLENVQTLPVNVSVRNTKGVVSAKHGMSNDSGQFQIDAGSSTRK